MSRRRWGYRWYRFARSMGCKRRFAWRIFLLAYLEGPEAWLERAEADLVIEDLTPMLEVPEEYATSQREVGVMQ